MPINDTFPSTLTSLLVADEGTINNGSPDGIPAFSLGIDGQPVSAVAEFQSTEGGLLLPRMTTVQMNALNPADGLTVYDTTAEGLRTYAAGAWSLPVAGDVAGPPVPDLPVVVDNIVTWADIDGRQIKDSGVAIIRVPVLLSSLALVTVNSLENFALIKLDDTLHSGVGGIFLDSFPAIKFVVSDFGPSSQISTVFADDFSVSASSVSALVELQSTTGALLLSRMNTAEMNALVSPQNGMLLHNLETGKTVLREGNNWVDVISSGILTLNGAVTGTGSGTITTLLNTTVECQANTQIFNSKASVIDSLTVGIHNDADLDTIFQINSVSAPKLWLGYSASGTVNYIETHGFNFKLTNNGNARLVVTSGTGVTSIDATGNWTFPNTNLKGILDPLSAQDAATKHYVDTHLLTTISGAVTGTVSGASVVTTLNTSVDCVDVGSPFPTQKFQFTNMGLSIFNIDSPDSSTPTVLALTSGGDPLGTNAFLFGYSQDGNICEIDFGITDFHITDRGGNDRLVIINGGGVTGITITIDAAGNMIFP